MSLSRLLSPQKQYSGKVQREKDLETQLSDEVLAQHVQGPGLHPQTLKKQTQKKDKAEGRKAKERREEGGVRGGKSSSLHQWRWLRFP